MVPQDEFPAKVHAAGQLLFSFRTTAAIHDDASDALVSKLSADLEATWIALASRLQSLRGLQLLALVYDPGREYVKEQAKNASKHVLLGSLEQRE